MEKLYDYAMGLGVRVEYADLTQLRRNGDYCHELRVIRIQDGLMPRKERHTLAHELAHATFGDEPSMFPWLDAKREARADEWAALFLIDSTEFSESEQRHGGHAETMAAELYVIPKTIEAYKRTLHRLGECVYVSPRMGTGQWESRIPA